MFIYYTDAELALIQRFVSEAVHREQREKRKKRKEKKKNLGLRNCPKMRQCQAFLDNSIAPCYVVMSSAAYARRFIHNNTQTVKGRNGSLRFLCVPRAGRRDYAASSSSDT
ncbi:hypothetical protein TMatcc_000246 [Talaromyces marneffei ATCC 18224]